MTASLRAVETRYPLVYPIQSNPLSLQVGHWSDVWILFADGDLTWFLRPDIRGGEPFVLCGAVIDKMSIELWARAWPVCGKSDKEAAPRVQRAITHLPGGVHGCIGVYSWGVYYPTDPPIQNLHNPHPFAYLRQWQKLSLFWGPKMAFPIILDISWVPHLLPDIQIHVKWGLRLQGSGLIGIRVTSLQSLLWSISKMLWTVWADRRAYCWSPRHYQRGLLW